MMWTSAIAVPVDASRRVTAASAGAMNLNMVRTSQPRARGATPPFVRAPSVARVHGRAGRVIDVPGPGRRVDPGVAVAGVAGAQPVIRDHDVRPAAEPREEARDRAAP